MLKVTNISKSTISIGGIYIKPGASYIFPSNTTEYIKDRINSLSILGIVKVTAIKDEVNKPVVEPVVENIEVQEEKTEETTPKKSNKKSNK